MYRDRLETIINELDDIIYHIRRGGVDPIALLGTNIEPSESLSSVEELEGAFNLIESFIDNKLS